MEEKVLRRMGDKEMTPDFLYKKEPALEREQLYQFARILKYHAKHIHMVMDDGTKVALAEDMIEMLSRAVLALYLITTEEKGRA